ncbi:MAG: hypothetical protein GX267_18240 [Fibrobacter sp.]|nr:hypothetical protein [Fibrobacter sp.]
MKKHFSLFVMVLLISTYSEAKKIPGFFINKEGDTVYVTFNVTVSLFRQEAKIERIQEKIRYYDSLNNTNTLKPENASEVVIVNSVDTIRMLSRTNNLGLGSFFARNGIFLRLIKDGTLKLFKYYESKSSAPGHNNSNNTMSGGYTYEIESYILQKKNEPLFRTRSQVTFRKDMTDYLSDCPELVKKIEQKKYRKEDMALIVEEYNKLCH